MGLLSPPVLMLCGKALRFDQDQRSILGMYAIGCQSSRSQPIVSAFERAPSKPLVAYPISLRRAHSSYSIFNLYLPTVHLKEGSLGAHEGCSILGSFYQSINDAWCSYPWFF